MANFLRLIALLLSALVWSAFALEPVRVYTPVMAPATAKMPWSEACLYVTSWLGANSGSEVPVMTRCDESQGSWVGYTRDPGGGQWPKQYVINFAGFACPAGYVMVGNECTPDPNTTCTANAEKVNGICQCKVGFKHEAGGCQFDNVGACSEWVTGETVIGGLWGREQAFTGRVNDGQLFCNPFPSDWPYPKTAGCRIQFDQQMVATNHDGSITSYGKVSPAVNPASTDTSGRKDYACSIGDAETPKQPEKPKCPNGAPGTVNGVEVCVPRQPNNGVETGMKDEKSVNDGEKTTTTKNDATTVCKDGKCTTTTVTTTTVTNNSTGATTTSSSTSTATTGKDDFCSKNPKNAQCNGTGTGTGGNGNGNGDGEKDPSKFGGGCAGGFTCEGDAIQCAIAKEQHARNCKLYGPDDDANSFTNKALAGTDGYSMDKLKSEAQQVAIGTFDQAGLGWSHGCPADPSIPLNFGGRSAEFSIPFSRICGPLGILSLAGVGITLLGSMVWVLGGRNNRG